MRLASTRTTPDPAGDLKPADVGQPPKSQQHNAHALNCSYFSRGPKMTLKRRSEEPARHKPGRSPLGMSHYGDGREKELRKAGIGRCLPQGSRTGSGCRRKTRPDSHPRAQPSGPNAIRKPGPDLEGTTPTHVGVLSLLLAGACYSTPDSSSKRSAAGPDGAGPPLPSWPLTGRPLVGALPRGSPVMGGTAPPLPPTPH